jgi:hypothetical protein
MTLQIGKSALGYKILKARKLLLNISRLGVVDC